jgi:hypothetical protein
MPVRLDGTSSDFIELSSSGLPSATAYTIVFFMQVVTANAGVDRQFWTYADSGGAVSEHRIWRPSSNNDGVAIAGSSVGSLSGNENETDWYMWAMTSSGTGAGNGNAYSWKVGDPDGTYNTLSFTPSTFTPGRAYIGGTFYNTGRNARFCFVKMWDAALSLAELQAERRQGSPVRTSNVNRYHRLTTAAYTTDESGNGRTVTSNGAATEGTEPVPWVSSRKLQLLLRGM